MVDNSNMPHPKCLGSQKIPGTEPKTCEKGLKLGFEYLPTSKTSHCVRTACTAFPWLRAVSVPFGRRTKSDIMVSMRWKVLYDRRSISLCTHCGINTKMTSCDLS